MPIDEQGSNMTVSSLPSELLVPSIFVLPPDHTRTYTTVCKGVPPPLLPSPPRDRWRRHWGEASVCWHDHTGLVLVDGLFKK